MQQRDYPQTRQARRLDGAVLLEHTALPLRHYLIPKHFNCLVLQTLKKTLGEAQWTQGIDFIT